VDILGRFRIDESGYTGFDLLNAEQRFQGAAAIAISDQDARRLISEHFPRLQASELKYRALSRRPANHPRLLSLQRDLLSSYKCVTYVCDKRYLLVLMFVDYAVEPFYYERGMDFYANGQNYAMASLLSVAGPTLLGQPAFDRLLASFQQAVKEKTPAALKALVAAARAMKWDAFAEALGPLAQLAAPECLSAIANPEEVKEQFNASVPSEDRERFAKSIADVAEKMTTYAGSAADPGEYGNLIAARLCPDTLPYELGTSAAFEVASFNGRALGDDVLDVMLTLAANTPIVDGLAPDRGRIRKDFPYYGAPYTAEEQVGVTPIMPRPAKK
jgi:hypothetical protein